MSTHILELTLSSQPDQRVKLRFSSSNGRQPLRLVGVDGGTLAFDLWQIGLRQVELTGVSTKADFVNGLIAEYPRAGELQQPIGHVLEHWTWVRIEPRPDRTVPGRLVIIDVNRTQLFTDQILDESLLVS